MSLRAPAAIPRGASATGARGGARLPQPRIAAPATSVAHISGPTISKHATMAARAPSRRSAGKTRSMMGSRDCVQDWIENNLDSGKVTRSSGSGSSQWASMTTYETEKGKKYFAKVSPGRSAEEMFAGEAEGLKAMWATKSLKIPEVYHYGPLLDAEGMPAMQGSFILMEFLEFGGRSSQADLGRAMAQMHLAEPAAPEAKAGKFGFPVDNTIGGTPQPNGWMDDWVEFFSERRIMHQCRVARDPDLMRLGEKVCEKMPELFEGIEVKPSILHGDLWSGNIASVAGAPSVYDPACYYGHHEAEWGMSWCAGFSGQFWDAYHEIIPKAPGHAERADLYTAYHILNHYNLFGGGYYSQAKGLLQRLAGETGSMGSDASSKFFDF